MATDKNQTRKEYNKLIRDKIPQIISAAGRNFATESYPEQEFRHALLAKLVEEAREAGSTTNSEELLTELADLYEVIDTIIVAFELDKAELLAIQSSRRQERGGFSNRLKLLWTENG